jgi:glycosyltransferase involved in cell wall biosynthesis
MNKPFFSIVIPTFNRVNNLKFAIYCILRQNFRDFEIVVSDNCSTDSTNEIVRSLKDRRIKYFKNKKNIGSTGNLRKAIGRGQGNYIFIHGDDDFLLEKNTLLSVYKNIKKNNFGFVRLNYAVRAPDKKKIFHYHGKKPYSQNYQLPIGSKNIDVLSFILDSDCGFMTGLIFKNELPKKVTVVSSDFLPWVSMLFYASKRLGAYFISKPSTIASWSIWRPNRGGQHIMFSLVNGKLATENFLSFVRENLTKNAYEEFLRKHLWLIYVTMLPAIRFYVGRGDMLKLVSRLKALDKNLTRNIFFWIYFILALVFPRFLLKFGRDLMFYAYSRFSKVANDKKILAKIKIIEQQYERTNK